MQSSDDANTPQEATIGPDAADDGAKDTAKPKRTRAKPTAGASERVRAPRKKAALPETGDGVKPKAEALPKPERKRVAARTPSADPPLPGAPRNRRSASAKAKTNAPREKPLVRAPRPARGESGSDSIVPRASELAARAAAPRSTQPNASADLDVSTPAILSSAARDGGNAGDSTQASMRAPGIALPEIQSAAAPTAAFQHDVIGHSDDGTTPFAQAMEQATATTDRTTTIASERASATTDTKTRQRDQSSANAIPVPSFARQPAAPVHAAHANARPADASPRSTAAIEWLVARLRPGSADRARNYLVLMRLDRPVGALLLLWPTWWALWFAANDFPPLSTLAIFTLGVFVMRSAGCVINDYADHDWLDGQVERTRARPMAAGRVSRGEALKLFGGLLAFAFLLVCFTNRLTIELSFVGAALAAVYPFSKRVTHLAQVVLGAAFGWSIPMAFAAITGTVPMLAWLLFLANILFSTIYDTEYAMVDRDDDLCAGAKSTAILFGDADRAIIGVLMATFLLAMLLAGTRVELGWPYFIGLGVACVLFTRQWRMLRDRSREHCFAAFRNNNWVGFALWIGLLFALAIR